MKGRRQRSRRLRPVFDICLANVWFCDLCKAHGPATFEPDEAVKSAIEKIRSAHTRKSPMCIHANGTAYLRIVSLESLKDWGLIA